MARGQQKTGKLRCIVECNELLHFAKNNADIKLRYEPFETDALDDLRLAVMFDAAHGVREDGTSQGGYLAILVPKQVYQEESSQQPQC